MTATVIGLGGRLRAGKDAVADHLVAEHGFVRLGMSDALHEALLAIDPIIEVADIEIRYSDAINAFGYVETKDRYPEARRLLQALGTEVGRNMVGESVWVDITARKVDDNLRAGRPVVVTGVRFPNEVQMIRQFAGRAVWVERPGLETAASAAGHASENSVSGDDFDVTLLNDGTLQDLYAKVDRLMAA